MKAPTSPLVSVVVPCYNAKGTIDDCLGALTAQRPGFPWELIVVDSSSDGTDTRIARIAPEARLLHFQERVRCGQARNLGIRAARGDYVLFTDADCVVPPDWIAKMVDVLLSEDLDGICGSLANGTPWNISGTVGFLLEFFRFLGPRGPLKPTPFLLGANCGYRRALLDGDTPFPNRNAGDDFTGSWRVFRRGGRLAHYPAVRVTHWNRTGWRRVLRYQYHLGRSAVGYRCETSPRVIRLLRRFPFLVAVAPMVIVAWVGYAAFRRSSFSEILRYLVTLPLLLFANGFFALGFYRGLREAPPN
jgi:glycosyltransferase involved in cell wall biosynthesis